VFGKLLNMKEVHFAENLKSLRSLAGMTQKQLAKLLDVDQRTVSAWEKQVCQPSFELLAKLCDIFDETFDGLLS
ncbi:MAG: helix-turn-helix domain-containing protein, partial [Clostridia bacterium]|nr:helix-turn-helix domain-containing protein [Clostridia bacterium]